MYIIQFAKSKGRGPDKKKRKSRLKTALTAGTLGTLGLLAMKNRKVPTPKPTTLGKRTSKFRKSGIKRSQVIKEQFSRLPDEMKAMLQLNSYLTQ